MTEILITMLVIPVMAVLAGWIMGRNDVDPEKDPDYYK